MLKVRGILGYPLCYEYKDMNDMIYLVTRAILYRDEAIRLYILISIDLKSMNKVYYLYIMLTYGTNLQNSVG